MDCREHQFDVRRAGQHRCAAAESVFVDHPVIRSELAEAFGGAVATHTTRMQDRMFERDIAGTEVLTAQGVECHARLGPDTEIDRHDVQVAALARHCVHQRVGCGVGGLTCRSQCRGRRPDEDQQGHAMARQVVDQCGGAAGLCSHHGFDVGPVVEQFDRSVE
jgi:hypothetical protein